MPLEKKKKVNNNNQTHGIPWLVEYKIEYKKWDWTPKICIWL